MNDYKRFISYIYNYEKKIKKNNIGFARVEMKENQCKITIHIQVKSIQNGNLQIYGFIRREANVIGIPLGTLILKNGRGDCQIFTKKDRIGESSHDFSELSGMILYLDESKYFGSEWDDRPLVFKRLITEEKEEELNVAELVKEETEAVTETEEGTEEETLLHTELTEEASEESSADRKEAENDENNDILETERAKVNTEQENEQEINVWFEPYTLEELYKRFAYTVKNDFMLHGYHRFGHLGVLKYKNRYILGVPGIFCRQEEQYAKKSGFHNFVPKNNKALRYGDFGYWYNSREYLK